MASTTSEPNRTREEESSESRRNESLRQRVFSDSTLNRLVNGSAVAVVTLMAVFFMIVINNTQVVQNQITTLKEGPYNTSVVVGKVEAIMVRFETVVDEIVDETTYETIGRRPSHKNQFEEALRSMESLKSDDYIIEPVDTSRYEDYWKTYDKLIENIEIFYEMCWSDKVEVRPTYEEIVEFATQNFYPQTSHLLELNTQILTENNERVDSIYNTVTDATSTMNLFILIMFILVVGAIVLYVCLLAHRNRLARRLYESLAEALDSAKEANEAKSTFMSNMSHDIRTPMNAIIGLVAIADENIDDKLRVKQCLTRISTSSQHLLSLINDVLDMHKIESGKVTLTRKTFSMNDLISQIETIVESQPQAQRLHTEIDVVDLKHDILIGDTMRVRQILLNLMSNALKYTKDGSVKMTVREEDPEEARAERAKLLVYSTRADNPAMKEIAYITVVVEDTGIGMEQDFLEHIFEPFERERNDYTIFTEGTGLGMAITKKLVDFMDGYIQIDSEVGVGTKVTVNLVFGIPPESEASDGARLPKGGDDIPERRTEASGGSSLSDGGNSDDAKGAEDMGFAKDPKGAEDEKSSKDAKASKAPKKKMRLSGRVLIAEDNEINMEIACTLIGARGVETDQAANGLEAVEKVTNSEDGHYDVVLMDLQMPKMNGLEATRAIREMEKKDGRRHTTIIAMTANAFDSDRESALDAGMDDFLTKPIDISQLEQTLASYLDRG